MVLNITSALSLFVLIALSTVIFFISKRTKLPYTVLLVFVGLMLVPIAHIPYIKDIFGFIDDLVLTPELLFYIFLPVLIFECGFNMSIRKMLDNAWTISTLAVVGLIVSTLVIAGLLYFILPMIGIEIPFIIALLFGAIISPTDPVAVLSLFKEAKAPKRLSIIFEGESLFNDGTAMALFFVLLGVATTGFQGTETIIHGVVEFALMIILGAAIGLAMAGIFSRALRFTKKSEFVTITLIIISAHLVFICTEIINHTGILHVSSIIATTFAALFLGNYSRHILPLSTDSYLTKLVEHMAFVVNSLVFLMAGLLFASAGIDFKELWLPILIAVFVVAFARIIAVYSVTQPLKFFKIESDLPSSWEKLLAWGSLRGALSIIIVMLIPEDFTIAGWNLPYSPHDFLLALTVGCILATLFIKAPLITPIMRKYNINEVQPLKEAHEADLTIYFLRSEKNRLLSYKNRGYLSEEQYTPLNECVQSRIEQACLKRQNLVNQFGTEIFAQSLHLALVHVEKKVLKKLFMNEELTEPTYRKIYSKLSLQQEKIECAQHNQINPKIYTDEKNIFDRLVSLVHGTYKKKTEEGILCERLEYYRTQMIIARKAVETVEKMNTESGEDSVFLTHSYDEILQKYKNYKENSEQKMFKLLNERREILESYYTKLSERSLEASGIQAMHYLSEKGLVDETTEEEIKHYCAQLAAPLKKNKTTQ